jgi:hypothetical protein
VEMEKVNEKVKTIFVSSRCPPISVMFVLPSLSGTELSQVSTGDILKNGVFWVVTPCGSCKNRRFGGTWRLHHQGDKNR